MHCARDYIACMLPQPLHLKGSLCSARLNTRSPVIGIKERHLMSPRHTEERTFSVNPFAFRGASPSPTESDQLRW